MFEEVNKRRERERERIFFFSWLCYVVSIPCVYNYPFLFLHFGGGENTLNRCKTRTAFLYWRRWWEQPRHHKERKAHKLSSKARSFVLQRSLACWSCSQFSSTPLFPFPSLSLFLPLLFLTLRVCPHSQNLECIKSL